MGYVNSLEGYFVLESTIKKYDLGFAKTLVHREQIIFSNLFIREPVLEPSQDPLGFPVLRQGPEV